METIDLIFTAIGMYLITCAIGCILEAIGIIGTPKKPEVYEHFFKDGVLYRNMAHYKKYND